MRIDIRLDPDFTKWFERAKKKYGDELANLNGLDKKQLNLILCLTEWKILDIIMR